MSSETSTVAVPDSASAAIPIPEINLRDRWLAAFLAWLLPGAGHLYQRRYGKGLLFMVCILSTFFYGIFLGSGNVVYASFRKDDGRDYLQDDVRYAYLCQVGIGLPALPAIVQARRVGGENPKAPLWDGVMAPPVLIGQRVHEDWIERLVQKTAEDKVGDFRRRHFERLHDSTYERYLPRRPSEANTEYSGQANQLSMWHQHYGSYFDLGTVFTMIAGLLNVLVVFDAWGGPMAPEQKKVDEKKGKD
ncbi:MAG: DUF6677 family protein [Pirellulales bacterium]